MLKRRRNQREGREEAAYQCFGYQFEKREARESGRRPLVKTLKKEEAREREERSLPIDALVANF